MEISISTTPTFNFKRTAISRGWYDLPPFELTQESWTLWRVIDLGVSRPLTVAISEGRRAIRVVFSRNVGARAIEKITRDVRHMLRLDDDMSQFYDSVARDPDFSWIASSGAGRMLRSPTVFEDLVKMICTTNCSWALTDKMVIGLVNELGRESADGRKSFPTAAAMAEKPETFFREQIRAGYRAPYLAEFAQRAASGSLDVEAWLTSDLPLSD